MVAIYNTSLLERLRNPGKPSSLPGVFDRHDQIASVQANLQILLGTRRGSAAAQMDMGLPDRGIDSSLQTTMANFKPIIAANIERYEPRLVKVSVLSVKAKEGEAPAWLIEGLLRDDPNREYVSFLVTFDERGGIVVLQTL